MKGKTAYTISRVLLGLSFVFFGATKFYPGPSASTGLAQPAMDFLNSMVAAGYFIPFVGLVEFLIGIMLLANRWVPLSMIVLAPVMINVILFNVFLAPSISSAIMLVILTALQVHIMWYTWEHYKPLFARTK